MKKPWVVGASVTILAVAVGGALVVGRSTTRCDARHADEARQAITSAQPDEIVLRWQKGSPLGGSSTELIVYGDLSAFSADTDASGRTVWHTVRLDPSVAEATISCLIDDGMADVPTSIPPQAQAVDLGGASFAGKISTGPAREGGLPDDVPSDAPDPHADDRAVARTLALASMRFTTRSSRTARPESHESECSSPGSTLSARA